MNFEEVGKKNYLNYSTLVGGIGVEGIGYVINVDNSLTKNEAPYYKIFIKTVDNVVITAFVFNILDISTAGFKLNALKHKYIKVKGIVSEKYDVFSIILNSCEVLQGSDVEEAITKFQNVLPNIDDYFDTLSGVYEGVINKPLNPIYKSKRFTDLYQGGLGGLVVYGGKVIIHLSAFVAEEDLNLALTIFVKSLFIYEKLLQIASNANLVTTSDKLQIISSCPNETSEDKLIIETLSGLMGLSNPNHLIPVSIKMVSDLVMSSSRLYDTWRTLLPGGSTQCLDYQLLKY